MHTIPKEKGFDSSLALFRDGYRFISRRCERHQSDLFRTRLLLRPTICMRGEAAARLFYDESRFRRQGAAPRRLQKVLVGEGGVQGLDDADHRNRKQMFMSLMTPEAISELSELSAREWERGIARWQKMQPVVLHEQVQQLLCRAVCAWAGVPLQASEIERRTADMAAMIAGSANIGPGYLRGRIGRRRAERWIGQLIDDVRDGRLQPGEQQALHVIAWHKDNNGELLDTRVAAVEVLNVLRPVVAVARFITFAALSLWEHPQWRQTLSTDDAAVEPFVQEVRRLYAFFPFIAAVVRDDFDWQGYRFPKGTRVMLDLYGTNRDERVWEDPDAFRPERFRQWDGSAYNFITQGGGDHYQHHRCAGEWISIALTEVGVKALTRWMQYDVPDQDLGINLSRMPMIPRSGFVIDNIRRG